MRVENNNLKIAFQNRFEKISAKLAKKDVFYAILETSTTCPLALLRVPCVLRSIVSLTPSSAKLLIETSAISWLAQIAYPGFLEFMVDSLKQLPTYTLTFLSTAVQGLYDSVSELTMTQSEARSRIYKLFPSTRDCAAELLAAVANLDKDSALLLSKNEAFMQVFRHWLTVPLISYENDSSTLSAFIKILKVFCSYSSIADKLVRELNLIRVLMRLSYLPAIWPTEDVMCCVRSLLSFGSHLQQLVAGNLSIMEMVFIHLFSTCDNLTRISLDCLKVLKTLDSWPALLTHMVTTNILTAPHCYSLALHRTADLQSMGRFLLTQASIYTQIEEFSLNPEVSPTSYREAGNVHYRGKNFTEAIAAYSIALHLALLQCNTDEILKAYGNRAQCHLQLGHSLEALRDTSLSLYHECLDPVFETVLSQDKLTILAKNLQRRSTAFLRLGEPVCAMADLARSSILQAHTETTQQLRDAAEKCEQRDGWKILCGHCRSLCRYLHVCGSCRKAAYCSLACESSAAGKGHDPECSAQSQSMF